MNLANLEARKLKIRFTGYCVAPERACEPHGDPNLFLVVRASQNVMVVSITDSVASLVRL
jgi:hypothetical protein